MPNPNPQPWDERLPAALERARDAYWREIATAFPEVTHGDVGPDWVFEWDSSTEKLTRSWLYGNWPEEQAAQATLSADGRTVRVTLTRTLEGPRLSVNGVDCDLDGEMPGVYYLRPLGEGSATLKHD